MGEELDPVGPRGDREPGVTGGYRRGSGGGFSTSAPARQLAVETRQGSCHGPPVQWGRMELSTGVPRRSARFPPCAANDPHRLWDPASGGATIRQVQLIEP